MGPVGNEAAGGAALPPCPPHANRRRSGLRQTYLLARIGLHSRARSCARIYARVRAGFGVYLRVRFGFDLRKCDGDDPKWRAALDARVAGIEGGVAKLASVKAGEFGERLIF